MEVKPGYFTVKLKEMNKEYLKLQSHLQNYQSQDRKKIIHEIEQLKDDCHKDELLLKQMVAKSRSPLAVSLAKAQQEYKHKTDQYLQRLMQSSSDQTICADIIALYAEYSLDFATLSIKQALLAALSAIDLQLEIDETSDEQGKREGIAYHDS